MADSQTNAPEGDEPREEAVDKILAGEESAEATATPSSEETSQLSELEQLQQQLQEANDRALRTQAELENYRKRAQREMADERKYAAMPMLRSLLGVVDNLNRAIQAAEQNDSASGLLDGVKMVSMQLTSVLEQHHCTPVPALGADFDPNLHEAVAQQPSDEYPAGKVTMVAVEGFTLHDRVVRPAQVMVSTGPPAADDKSN